mmetsp:Transcript_13515/g.21275  ORF Transcript_13515/g.21275 Transcript_13515/m.21275 type:complete len:94 (+) Transcript_13515:1-282(+)
MDHNKKDWTLKASLDFLKGTFLKAGNTGKKELRAGITLAMVSYLQQLPTRVIRSEMGQIIEKNSFVIVESINEIFWIVTRTITGSFMYWTYVK